MCHSVLGFVWWHWCGEYTIQTGTGWAQRQAFKNWMYLITLNWTRYRRRMQFSVNKTVKCTCNLSLCVILSILNMHIAKPHMTSQHVAFGFPSMRVAGCIRHLVYTNCHFIGNSWVTCHDYGQIILLESRNVCFVKMRTLKSVQFRCRVN